MSNKVLKMVSKIGGPKIVKNGQKWSKMTCKNRESGFLRFTNPIILYLTFSESFEIIEAIFQKILAEPKISFSKIGNFLLKWIKIFLDCLIFFQILVQFSQNILRMVMLLLFYDVKLKNPDSLFLQVIFDHF